MITCIERPYESGRGQPHSKTLRKEQRAEERGSVLECGCLLPLFGLSRASAIGPSRNSAFEDCTLTGGSWESHIGSGDWVLGYGLEIHRDKVSEGLRALSFFQFVGTGGKLDQQDLLTGLLSR